VPDARLENLGFVTEAKNTPISNQRNARTVKNLCRLDFSKQTQKVTAQLKLKQYVV
jgi:hypothetical protein